MQDFNIILTREQIQNRVKDIAKQIDNDFRDKKKERNNSQRKHLYINRQ